MNYAYVTILSSLDYLDGLLVLNKSLQRVNSKYPLVAVITKDIFSKELYDICQEHGIKVEVVFPLQYCEKTRIANAGEPVLNTASKIQIFNLVHYDKLVYLDIDIIVLKNFDDLFTFKDGSILENPEADDPYDPGVYTSLFVFEPKNHSYNLYKFLIENYTCFDGNLIEELFFFFKTDKTYAIPTNYMRMTWFSNNDLPDIRSIHFCGNPKPWEKEYIFNENRPAEKLYKELLNQIH